MASLLVTFPNNSTLVPIIRRAHDDLPPHVKGAAVWLSRGIAGKGYYIPPEYTTSNNLEPVEFINNQWYRLVLNQRTVSTRQSLAIAFENSLGLGWWTPADPAHPNYQPPQPPSRTPSHSTFRAPQNVDSSSSSGSSTASIHTTPDPDNNSNPPTPSISSLSLTLPAPMSVAATGHSGGSGGGSGGGGGAGGGAPAGAGVVPPSNGGMRGIAPIIFDGTRSHADEFLDQF